MQLEAVIPAAPKDYVKLPYVLPGLFNTGHIGHIHIITPQPAQLTYRRVRADKRVSLHADQDVFPFDYSKYTYLPNWLYQQFLKLFQNVTKPGWFVVSDADTILMKKIDFFTDEKHKPQNGFPRMFTTKGKHKRIQAYDDFNGFLFGEHPRPAVPVLNNIALYHTDVIEGMLQFLEMDRFELADKVFSNARPQFYPAEAEMYAAYYVMSAYIYPFTYLMHPLANQPTGKYGSEKYNEKEVIHILKNAWPEADTVCIHNWDRSDNETDTAN